MIRYPPGILGGENEIAVSTTGNIDNFDFGNANSIRMFNASATVFRGLKAGYPGQHVLIYNSASSTVKTAYQDANSTAENRFITTSTNGQIIGAGGILLATYDNTSARWRIGVLDAGQAINVTFNAGDFTGSGAMTWTVASTDVDTFKYIQDGCILKVWLSIKTSTVGGVADANLFALIPGGFTSTSFIDIPAMCADAGVFSNNFITGVHPAHSTKIRFVPLATTNWSLSTDTTWCKVGPLTITVA